jgi:tRNA-dihydrouridine synthase B
VSGLVIGKLALRGRVVCSPMEGVSDVGFRALAWQGGAALTFTEMIRARGIVKNNKSTLDLIDTIDESVPTGLQLMVVNERELLGALRRIEELAFTTTPRFQNIRVVDLNFGCPSPDVVQIGAGPALLKRRAKLAAIFTALRAFQRETKLPIAAVGCKIRLGLNQQEAEHKVFLPVVELAGEHLDYIVVHGRHAKQRSRDKPDWHAIKEAKARARIPMLGNGDVFSGKDAKRMFEETGVDGIMVARAAIRNPWIFDELEGRVEHARFSVEQVGAAEAAWHALAARIGTKDKYREFHLENFRRLKDAAAGKSVAAVVPKNAHID